MMNRNGIIQNNVNAFAIAYRLIDLFLIQIVLYLTIYSFGKSYNSDYLSISLISSISFIISGEFFALYRSWRSELFKELVFYTFISWGFTAITILAFIFFSDFINDISREVIVTEFAVTFLMLILWRFLFMVFLMKIRKMGFNTRSVALIGLTEEGIRLAQQIRQHPEKGYRLVAIYDDRIQQRIPPVGEFEVDGKIQDGIDKAKLDSFDIVFIALPMTAEKRIKEILFLLGDSTANVQLVPNLFVYCLMNASMSRVGDIQTISIYNNPMSGANALIKRIEDILLSIIILTIISIPLILISIGVKLSSKGPIIYKQQRYGLSSKKIKIWKFRTMLQEGNDEKFLQATKNDSRVTPFGAFLRRTSLDELPQFFNVLFGEMSVVGPRPHAVSQNEDYRKKIGYYMLRHKVKPGITGWAQVNGWRGETDTIKKMEMRIEYDLDYIRNWSLWMDFKIVIFTVLRSFNDKNAY